MIHSINMKKETIIEQNIKELNVNSFNVIVRKPSETEKPVSFDHNPFCEGKNVQASGI